MSAASRKNDPFHFDEIYRQAGVEDLFVKKTLGELKQQKPAPGPVPASSPARPAAASKPPAPAQNVSSFDLDFLSTITTPGGTPPHLSKPNSTTNLSAAGGLTQLPQKDAPAVSSKPADDPFALFQEVPGAAPAQRHAPPPATRALAADGLGDLLGFGDDGHAFPQPGPAPSSVERAAAFQPGMLAVPTGASSVPPLVQLSPQPQSRAVALEPSATGLASSRSHQPLAALSPAAEAAPRAAAPQPLPSPSAGAPPPPPPDYASHSDHRAAPPGPQRSHATGPAAAVAAAEQALPPSAYASLPDGLAAPAGGRNPHYPTAPGAPFEPEATNSSSPSFSWGHPPSGSGLSGVLKAFGKKAVRVAKAGLQQLEHALEGLDQPAGQAQSYGQAYAGAPPSFGGRTSSSGVVKSYDDGAAPSNDEALAWAVRLADLPPHAQEHELAHMAPALRRKVIEVLREQIRSEHEAATGLAQPQPFPSPGPPGPTSAGHGHAPALSPRADAAGGAIPPGHGHGAGAPGGPPPYGRGSSQDSGVGYPQGPVRREQQQQQQQQQPSYADAGYQPPAAPAPPAPVLQVHETHDLLGMGSGGLASPPAAAVRTGSVAGTAAARAAPAGPASSSAAAAPAAGPVSAASVSSAVVVDDLLGFGEGSGITPASRSTSTGLPNPPAAPAPQPPPAAATAPPPPTTATAAAPASSNRPATPPAAVHVDDMDDFFSGGRSSGGHPAGAATAAPPTGRVPSASMHPSSSAPNLAGRGAPAPSGSSSAAALADMLLHDDDDGGLGGLGAGGDVDVSGYEDLYRGEQGQADEPELRKRLRAQREAAKHAKMKAALAEKKAMEAEEAARREQQVALKDQYKADIEAWKNKHKGNIRGLLGTLHTVLWPDSGWTPVSVGDLLDPVQIKKVYMKANLLVHPDKVRQRNGSADQVAIADMIFDVLKEAWNAFR